MGGRKFRLDVHRKNEERKKKLKRLNCNGKDIEKKKQCKGTIKNAWKKKKCEQPDQQQMEPDLPEKEPNQWPENDSRGKELDQSNTCPDTVEMVENHITLPTITIPITAFTTGIVQSLPQLSRRISSLLAKSCTWTVASNDPLLLCKLNIQPNADVTTAAVICTISITNELQWTISYMSQQVDVSNCPIFRDQPKKIDSVELLQQIIELVDSVKVCIGNPEDHFLDLWYRRIQTLHHSSGTYAGYLDVASNPVAPTLRSNNCQLFLEENRRCDAVRCPACSNFRSSLIVQYARYKSRLSKDITIDTSHGSHINYRYQTIPELVTRLNSLQQEYRNVVKYCQRLKEKIALSCEADGMQVDDGIHTDLKEIASQNMKFIEDLPSDSFKRIFWEQQVEAASKKDSRSMRWHPLMIRWCLHLRHRSGGTYETLRSSGVLQLPSQRTLRDYTHYVEAASGFSADVDSMLMKAAKVESCPDREKCVIMLLDEMHLREDLVFDKHSGAMIGFCDLGDITMRLLRYESELTEEKPANQILAKSMMVFMIRGLFSSLQFPYAQFPCGDLSGDMLYEPFWEAVCRVEKCGLKVLAATLDGNSVNRRLIKLHSPKEDVTYKVINPYSDEKRYLYFFSDPPHLLKTIRNCWQSKNRNLWCDGKEISWSHLVALYNRDIASGKGIRLIPKIKQEHIFLTSFSKMRVDLAAQVLSNSVSKGLELVGGEEASETARFVSMMDQFFDALNVHNYHHGIRSRKPFQEPYTKGDDYRLKWLEDDFLGYLEHWEQSVGKRKGFSKTELGLMLISPPTRLGIKMTCKSFVALVRYLFTLPDVKSFLSQRICQDPLERFFGLQRQRGGVNDNPNVEEFQKNTQALRVVNSVAPPPKRGNCRGSKLDCTLNQENVDEPLPKRRRK